ncbi:putative alpha/beta-Hydrolase [Vibrio nigripulchritudo SFn27]|uniref:Putative alpha/beta-Hydrolase n=1 Tax=Vibrio nigripulchritudo TaxID=28173 RepID=U4KGT4_9VIBR|nr:Mbeg1-like protein [Vibrio nigripulchritudo]CCN84434.1 putative alpha/beta-Hydrolase [Vibrio nigripulchritudo BLFn1]CCN86481.1 putative alpha/beta-Hydrolase [Vibrio nigripulchritudo SFn27]CCN97024.1 putative alpha/beta-Hydrolase [Vibrio nigripulchritudo ENn2]CCO41617.1 putative alpha/beta-Hydrolase [Vibrio nigripulchritudo SFn135]CCO54222.1 putative alpha/beta-Hydrolase [Vibrio nigripulchritudo Wn13]
MKLKYTLAGTICLGLASTQSFALTTDEANSVGAYIEAVLVPNYTNTANSTGTTYKTHQPPSINQSADALKYLEFAEVVHTTNGAPQGWNRVENVVDYDSGFYAGIYTKSNKVVVAFRGSELGTSDWVTNGIMVQDMVPAQYAMAIEKSQDIKNRYSGYQIHYTGHSLGGGLATAAAITTGDPATAFDAAGLANAVLEEIKLVHSNQGKPSKQWNTNASQVTNYNLEGEFVSDLDYQQDADTLGPTSKQYGDIHYLSADRFTPLFIVNNGLTRHFTTPLKEELMFLSQPIYRVNTSDYTSIDNDINSFTAMFYVDWTDDTLDILFWQTNFAINSLPSLLADLGL